MANALVTYSKTNFKKEIVVDCEHCPNLTKRSDVNFKEIAFTLHRRIVRELMLAYAFTKLKVKQIYGDYFVINVFIHDLLLRHKIQDSIKNVILDQETGQIFIQRYNSIQ